MVIKKYLCAAPRPSSWDDRAEAILKSLGGDPKKRETVLRQTLNSLRELHEDRRRSGPGRKSNAEHAIGFYEYILDLNRERGDEDENKAKAKDDDEQEEEEEDEGDDDDDDGVGGTTSGHDGDEDDEKRATNKKKKKLKKTKKKSKSKNKRNKKGKKGIEPPVKRGRGRPRKHPLPEPEAGSEKETDNSDDDTEDSDDDSDDSNSAESSNNDEGNQEEDDEDAEEEDDQGHEEKTIESMDSVEFLNQHNDLCDVCNIGGELLCCSTCNLVFHLDCVRPILTELPPGDWSCAHCIIAGIRGHRKHSRAWKSAAAAVRHMGRLRNKKRVQSERLGVAWDDDLDEDGDGDDNEVTHESTNDNTEEQEAGKEAEDDESKSAAEKSDSSTTAPISKRRDSDRTPHRENKRKKKDVLEQEDSNAADVAEDEQDDDEEGSEAPEESKTPGDDTFKKTDVKDDKDEDDRRSEEEDADDGKIKESTSENEKEGDDKKRPMGKKTLALYKIADSLSPAMKIETGENIVRGQRPRRQPTLFNPQNCPDSEWQSDEKLILRSSLQSSEDDKSGTDDLKKKSKDDGKKKKSDDDENNGSKTSESKTDDRKDDNVKSDAPAEDQSPAKKSTGFLWCNFCKDDPSIPICCFCACRVCYGKHDKDKLLLCDRCDEEYHTFCLDPPLTTVPGNKWFCPTCEPLIKEELAAAKAQARSGTVTRKANVKFSAVVLAKPVPKKRSKSPAGGNSTTDSTATSPKISTGRPRGRPPKNKSPVVEVAVIASPPTPAVPRKRGRPPKTPPSEVSFLSEQTTAPIESPIPRKRGRPAKNQGLASPQPSKKQRTSQSPKYQPEAKKGKLKSPPPSSSTEKRKGGPGQSGKGDNKRAKIKADGSKRGKSDPSADVESILMPEIDAVADVKGEDGNQGKILMTSSQDEAIHEIKLSRSGRMLKRSSFHDEIEEGEQHLRSVKYAEAQRKAMEGGYVHQDEDTWEEEHDLDDEEQQQDAFEHVEEHDDDEDELKRAYEAEGNYEDVAGDEETDEPEDEPDNEMLDEMLDQESMDPSESVVVIDEPECETLAEPAAPILTISEIPTPSNDEASILPSVPEDPSNSTPLDQRKPAARTSTSESIPANSSGTAQIVAEPLAVEPPSIAPEPVIAADPGLPLAEKPIPPAHAPNVPIPTAALSSDVNLTKSTGGQSKKATAAASAATSDSFSELADTGDQDGSSGSPLIKIPRRKPGARECMQISRRFGVRVIPQKYMETLIDYCTRGKVEHLIRMRERLDEHSRYLEAQLAGLEALVQENGEIDVVVPPLPERPEATTGANSTGSQGGGNHHKKSGSMADASSQASQDGK